MNIIYFSNVWPQRKISSGNHRVFGIILALIKNGWVISFVCTAKKSKEAEEIKELLQVKAYTTDPDDIKSTTQFLNKLKEKPDVVIFDNFSTEEKFRLIK